MAIDALSAGRPHVTITFEPLPGTNPGAGPRPPSQVDPARAAAMQRERENATVQAFATVMAEQIVSDPLVSTSQMIARKLPGSPQNVYAQMQAIREENELVSERREIARKMAQKEDEITYRD
ncbi:MAG TPA: hypothetical protein VLQ65_12605 [Saliniramus sp.]|nr:hypothetical protein [Saliniramus sp.]